MSSDTAHTFRAQSCSSRQFYLDRGAFFKQTAKGEAEGLELMRLTWIKVSRRETPASRAAI
eukprot:scaffold272939_cov24-Prasinocladus_malaysianus.AAC.1